MDLSGSGNYLHQYKIFCILYLAFLYLADLVYPHNLSFFIMNSYFLLISLIGSIAGTGALNDSRFAESAIRESIRKHEVATDSGSLLAGHP